MADGFPASARSPAKLGGFGSEEAIAALKFKTGRNTDQFEITEVTGKKLEGETDNANGVLEIIEAELYEPVSIMKRTACTC